MSARVRTLPIEALLPPEGHRYFTDERIEALRRIALDAETVTMDAFEVMELVCDWRNMTQELARAASPPEDEKL